MATTTTYGTTDMAGDSSLDDTGAIQNTQEEIDSRFTRVTEVFKPFNGLDKIDPEIVANAARRGKRVHDICEGIVKGVDPWEIPDEVKGYVNSFRKWWDEGQQVLAVEKRFFCSNLMITGQVDYIIQAPEGAVILDLKTTYKPSKTWPLQGSAYAYLARQNGYDIKGIHFLHLSKHGIKPHLYVYDDHFELFKKCLDLYNHFFKARHGKRI